MAYLFSAGAMLVAIAIMLGYALLERPSTYRYRITVEVETPEGLRVGSVVRELVYRKAPRLSLESKSFTLRQRGEAVAVDLPGAQTLFSLLDVNAADTVIAALGGGDRRRPVKGLLDQGGSGEYPDRATLRKWRLELPRLVRFRDPANPKSVEPVDPYNLAESFGRGTKLRRIVVQLTDEPMNGGLEKRLPWLSKHRTISLAGNRFSKSSELADNLFTGAFSTEIEL
jgi:hypothetical protein